ncbi:MAG: matrixin family metalloprotease [Candidatus Nanopelagicales bacterium]
MGEAALVRTWAARRRRWTAVAAAVLVVGTTGQAAEAAPRGAAVVDASPAATASVPTASVPAATAARSYKFESRWPNGKPVRWDPCRVITWRISYPAGRGWRKELPRVTKAFAELSRATGLTFRFLGTSRYVPFTPNRDKEKADILVAFAKPSQSIFRAFPGPSGYGGNNSAPTATDPDTSLHLSPYTTGDAAWRSNAVRRLTTRLRYQLYLHELGHVVGLWHVSNRTQIMYPSISTRQGRHYGAGDLAGLQLLGRSQGCVRVPSAPAAPTYAVSGDDLVVSVAAVSPGTGVTYRLSSSTGYVSPVGSALSWRIPITTLAGGGGDPEFRVTAVNVYGEHTGPPSTWPLPA